MHRSWLVEYSDASTRRWLPHAEPTRINARVLKAHGEVICAAFLEHAEVQLLRQNVQSSHLAHRLAALRRGACPRYVVHLTSDGLFHLRKLPQKHKIMGGCREGLWGLNPLKLMLYMSIVYCVMPFILNFLITFNPGCAVKFGYNCMLVKFI